MPDNGFYWLPNNKVSLPQNTDIQQSCEGNILATYMKMTELITDMCGI